MPMMNQQQGPMMGGNPRMGMGGGKPGMMMHQRMMHPNMRPTQQQQQQMSMGGMQRMPNSGMMPMNQYPNQGQQMGWNQGGGPMNQGGYGNQGFGMQGQHLQDAADPDCPERKHETCADAVPAAERVRRQPLHGGATAPSHSSSLFPAPYPMLTHTPRARPLSSTHTPCPTHIPHIRR